MTRTRPHLYVKRNWWQQLCWLLDCSTVELLIIIAGMAYQVYLVGCLFALRK